MDTQLQEPPVQPTIPIAPPNVPNSPATPNQPAAPVAPGTLPQMNVPQITVPAPDVPKYQVGVPNYTIPVLDPIQAPPGANPAINTLVTVANQGMSMLTSPIGTWLVKMDGAIIGGMDAALQGLTPALAGPVAAFCLLFLGARGVRIAQGDSSALHNLWFNLVKIMIVVGLSTNLANFDYYVRDLFYINLPNFLMTAVGGQLVTNGVNGTASTFDNIWALMWVQIANVWQQAGILDVGSRLAAIFCGITVGLALMAMALVYLLARMLLGIVIVFGPVCIACTLFEQTKPIFERWMGKVVALTCLQVAGIVLLTMLLAADKEFMTQIQPLATQAGAGAFGASGTQAPTVASDIENLVAMVIWFGMGAFAMYALPAIAYSIGTGVAASMSRVAALAGEAAVAVAAGASGLLDGGGASSEGSAGGMSMGSARDELTSGSSTLSLPPPSPPALSSATPPVPRA